MRAASILVIAASAVLTSASVQACTVFAATGSNFVQGGGTLISKVRDERSFSHTVKTIRPAHGLAYAGLFNGRNFNMGVNEKGFVVFRTTAGSVPKTIRRASVRYRSGEGLAGQEYLIRYCATVDEALKHVEIFSMEPTNYMMADAKKIASVEALPGGRHVVTVKDHGTLAHTNHYIAKDALESNQTIRESSRVRLNRIRELLDAAKKPMSVDDFIRFTEDRSDGPDNSIFRVGTPGRKTSTTLAAMSVHIPEEGMPEIHLKWRDDPGDKTSWRTMRMTIDFAE